MSQENNREALFPRRKDMEEAARRTWAKVQLFFEEEFGFLIPSEWHPDPLREPLSLSCGNLLAFSTRVDRLQDLLFGDLKSQPPGTWLAGYWGHGINSYGFYLVRKDERREMFLRLFYGGVYGDKKRDAEAAARFIQRSVAFEEWAKTNLDRWSIFSNMGDCRGWVERRGERKDLQVASDREFRFPNEGTSQRESA